MPQHEEGIVEVIAALKELAEDATVPRNVKTKLQGIVLTLDNEIEAPLKLSKALNEFDEIINDVNLEPHTRTQIWGVVSSLEKISQSLE